MTATAHTCPWCSDDSGDSVDLSGLTDRCAYRPGKGARCVQPAVYEVGLVYCWDEHCLRDPEHGEHCGESPSTTVACVEHGLVMRTDPSRWQCFRTIRTLATAANGGPEVAS